MHAEQPILERIQRRQLRWYGHPIGMKDGHWTKKIYQRTQQGEYKRGRPQQSWKNQVTDIMRSRNMEKYMDFGNG